jgi:lipid-binding SYLF domain-containing protein
VHLRSFMPMVMVLSLAASVLSAPLPRMPDSKDTDKRLAESADVLREIMSTPDKGIPKDLLDKAACVVVIPGVKKGAFIVGAKYGRGFIVCRKSTAGWSAPAGVRVEGWGFRLALQKPMWSCW